MAAITFEPDRLYLGERSLWCGAGNDPVNDNGGDGVIKAGREEK
jgi:hypothetical protein